jgi:hypothetical protein
MSHRRAADRLPRNAEAQERRIMAQVLTVISLLWAIVLLWYLKDRFAPGDRLQISIRLDRSAPGAHLLWQVVNTSPAAVTLTRFRITPRNVGEGRGESAAEVLLPETAMLAPGERAQLMMDVDWRLVSARAIAVCDAENRDHFAPRNQLRSVQSQLHNVIDRRASSARDWLFGATNLAFGVMILGLGFFMLMWIIATG